MTGILIGLIIYLGITFVISIYTGRTNQKNMLQ